MAKLGRNDPCHCGSGKKYKRCCLSNDAVFERQAIAAAAVTHDPVGFCDDCYDELVEASNIVVDLVDANKLNEAEQAARELLKRFPDVYDGYARLGLVYETRGDTRQAIKYYQKVIDFARDHPEVDKPGLQNDFRALINRLDPTRSATTPNCRKQP